MRSFLLLLFSIHGFLALSQQKDSLMTAATDSALLVAPDTAALSVEEKLAPSQTPLVSTEVKAPFKPNPRKAMLYSAIFPGLGQIYNRKYWKLPIVYGIFSGMSYAISWNNQYYQNYFSGYKDIMDDSDDTNSWHNFIPFGQTPETVNKEWLTGVLKSRKDFYRYYRDLSIIITVAVYGLNILDAYVDAQLYDFDISPDLSLKIEPVILRNKISSSYMANSFGLKCSFSF